MRLDGPRGALPALFAFTDPERTPDPVQLALALPPGAGLVLRTFGQPELEAIAGDLADIARAQGLIFLVAADPGLAARCGADGVHWPERMLAQAGLTRFALSTASAHSPGAIRRAGGRVDAVFVSPAFASSSPSAGRPLGLWRMAAAARRSPCPVYALGGVNAMNVRRLCGLGISGAAAIDGLKR
ncbi:thiamine phosphate synthase [Alkalicaulis satelles]|uniref:Thiamine phosphate synthase n=2 Tax=Alkalicaulis satelles TaxID=2609175 RepID=A0A5M6ZDR0_9PROT|nr:thiamine phosphate synthase [Alkalicaulis satelles]